jgi:hypothetical protein
MKRKRAFECGHRGCGAFCHRCKQRFDKLARESMKRVKWKAAISSSPVTLGHLPIRVAKKSLQLFCKLRGGASYTELHGKRMLALGHREIISIPVDYAHRLICKYCCGSLIPVEVISHETYNGRIRSNCWS